MSPFAPKVTIDVPVPEELRTNQVAVDGRKTAASARPSPSKSDDCGRSPAVPKGNEKNVEFSLRRMNHSPVDGRKKATSVRPSPVKSPGVIESVAAPNCA